MVKHNSKDQKGNESTFKGQALSLIKKILKKKPWELIAAIAKDAKPPATQQSINEDWVCIKRGLMIYFGNKSNWSKETYRVWREYLSDKIREEMVRESSEMQAFV